MKPSWVLRRYKHVGRMRSQLFFDFFGLDSDWYHKFFIYNSTHSKFIVLEMHYLGQIEWNTISKLSKCQRHSIKVGFKLYTEKELKVNVSAIWLVIRNLHQKWGQHAKFGSMDACTSAIFSKKYLQIRLPAR